MSSPEDSSSEGEIFRRYTKIQQHYYQKEIDWWIRRNPELEHCIFLIQEKLHGANIQLYFVDGVMYVGKRSRLIEPGDKFFDIWNALDRIKDFTDRVARFSKGAAPIILYGELFGKGIGKGVDYGPVQRIRFFDLKRGDEMQSPMALGAFFLNELKLEAPKELIVPALGTVAGIDAVRAYNQNFLTKINPVEGNWAEGFVAKPLEKVFASQEVVFMIKKKNEKFDERTKAKKVVAPNSDVGKLHEVMKSLATENRIQLLFSKMGEIEKPDQIGQYLAAFVADCKEEMLQEHSELFDSLDKAQQKNVCKVGHLAVVMLRRYL